MKKSFMTRILATGLSFAMAFSMAAVTNVTPASAASKPVLVDAVTGGSGRAVTVNVGEVAKLKVNAATKKTYAVSSVKKSSKKINTSVSKAGTVVYVRGVAETGEKDSAIRVSFKVKKTGKTSKFTFASKVKVVSPKPAVATIQSVTQNTATKLTATMTTAIEKIDLADVKVVRDDTQAVIAVKSTTIDTTDATKVVIETYTDMTDGKDYTVTYTAADEAKTESSAKFTATDAKIASFKLSTDKVTVNKATTIKYSAIDANGVVIYTKEINDKPNGIDVEYTCDNGYVDGAKLTLMAVGATAKVTVTYHTYKYDAAGTETGVVKGEFTITAEDNSATVSKFNYTIVNASDTPAWENVTVNTKLAMNDSDKVVRFQIKDSNGEDITKTCGYTVESSDGKVLLVSGNVKDGAALTPVAEGSVYLVLKDDTKTVTTLPITVVAKRVITNFELKKTAVAIATQAAVDTAGETSIGYTLKDQYGDKMNASVGTPVCKNWPSGASADTLTVKTDEANGMITIAADSTAKKGTYTYTVVATDKENKTQTRSFSVNVVQPSGDSTYSLQFVKNTGSDSVKGKDAIDTLDSTVTKDTADASHISVNVVEKKSGVVIGDLEFSNVVSVAAIKVVGSDGKTYAASGAGVSKVVTSDAIIESEVKDAAGLATDTNGTVFDIIAVDKSSNKYTKKLPVGTYNVVVTLATVKKGKKVTQDVAGSFKVEDKQPALTANVVSTTVKNETSIKAVLNNKDYVKYVYDGVTQIDENDASMIEGIETVYGKVRENSCVVNKVTAEVKIPGSTNNTVLITIPVNRVFTTDQTRWADGDFTAP